MCSATRHPPPPSSSSGRTHVITTRWDRSNSILLSASASFPSSLPAAIRARINEDRSSPRAWTPGQRRNAVHRPELVEYSLTAAAATIASGGCSCAFRPKVTYSSTATATTAGRCSRAFRPMVAYYLTAAVPAAAAGRCTRAFRPKIPRRPPRRDPRHCCCRRGGRPPTGARQGRSGRCTVPVLAVEERPPLARRRVAILLQSLK